MTPKPVRQILFSSNRSPIQNLSKSASKQPCAIFFDLLRCQQRSRAETKTLSCRLVKKLGVSGGVFGAVRIENAPGQKNDDKNRVQSISKRDHLGRGYPNIFKQILGDPK